MTTQSLSLVDRPTGGAVGTAGRDTTLVFINVPDVSTQQAEVASDSWTRTYLPAS